MIFAFGKRLIYYHVSKHAGLVMELKLRSGGDNGSIESNCIKLDQALEMKDWK